MKRTPEIMRAQARIAVLVRNGSMPKARRLRCADCSKPAQEYDHYLGYAVEHREDVQPVCQSCHSKRAHSRRMLHRNRCRNKIVGPRCKDGHFVSRKTKDFGFIGPRWSNGTITSGGRPDKTYQEVIYVRG